jgi:L-ribulokinase
MQIYADVCGRPMKISASAETCALGAAIFGAVVGGAHADTASAQRAMTGFKTTVFRPRQQSVAVYAELYRLYKQLHDAFGGVDRDTPAPMGNVMKDLIAIRDRVRKE